MLSRVFTYVCILVLFGCESKEYKKSQNENIQIVDNLNQGEPDKIIDKLSTKADLTPRQKSYLASAYSVKGGIDVFSLYHVLEMQLFKKNALEWSELSKEKNPYLKFIRSQENIDFEKRSQRRTKTWDKYDSRIQEKRPKKPDIKSEDEETDLVLKSKHEEIMALEPSKREEAYTKLWKECYNGADRPCGTNWQLYYYYEELAIWETNYAAKKERFISPEKNKSTFFSDSDWQMLVMNILWNTYEALPVMKQLPSLSDDQQEKITLSLDLYKGLIDDKEFGKTAVKNIAILAGVSLLSIYKESFDLEGVESMEDMMCSFEPDVLIENYDTIRARTLFLIEAVPASELGRFADYKAKLDDFKTKMPETLSEEEINKYHTQIDKFKMERCFNIE